uniref:Uncharacterized protein n=1 Tax=Coccolithus braarudii TaxID=221442 RepID=A0A7S0LAI9_9EUKA|mmetsp:Transcript_29286/g.62927  ORF Transcript_29286/g.62927 Transcript_29286/m.62927 type:complete len:270 (+) Transcript_29286:123-932(+)
MSGILQLADRPADSSDIGSAQFTMDTGVDVDEEMMFSHSAPGANGLEPSRSSRLARKAESARQARLRHKQFVLELQGQVNGLQARLKAQEMQMSSQPSAAHAIGELLGALKADQKAQLHKWLNEAQGENNILVRVTSGALAAAARNAPVPQPAAPPVTSPSIVSPMTMNGFSLAADRISQSTPIAIGGAHRHSPTDSDEDTFTMSRSWDDNEAARSILNLNSPNGFHPISGSSLPGNFVLPAASAAASAPSAFTTHFTSFTPRGVTANR